MSSTHRKVAKFSIKRDGSMIAYLNVCNPRNFAHKPTEICCDISPITSKVLSFSDHKHYRVIVVCSRLDTCQKFSCYCMPCASLNEWTKNFIDGAMMHLGITAVDITQFYSVLFLHLFKISRYPFIFISQLLEYTYFIYS